MTEGSSPHRRFPTASNKGDRKGRPYADLFWMSVGAIHESPVQAFPLRGRWPAGPDEVVLPRLPTASHTGDRKGRPYAGVPATL